MRALLKVAALLGALASACACSAAAGAAPAAGATPDACQKLRLHGKGGEAAACFEALARSGDPYLMGEGYWGLEDYQKAKQEFEIAVDRPKSPALWHVRYGMLFHARFNNVDAAKLYEEALQIEPGNALAYLGLAQLSADGFDGKSSDYIAKALASDPKLVAAHEFAADLALEDAKPEDAVKEADLAIGLSPYQGGSDALDAMAVRAAVDLLADKTADADVWLGKIKAVNPGYGQADVMVARQLVMNRRYTEAVAFYRKAIEAEPRLWIAHSELGINLMRLGQEDEPYRELELAFNNGQTDYPTSNSLKLLDSYKNFVTTKDDTTILRLYKIEADLLRPYFEDLLHQAIATYSAKYKMKLDGPVQLEVYPNHDDFAVRTMGMPGLGALGVTFGEVVAMDSPSGRTPGEFNWGATLWHEMSHVFILTATNHRIPRWFTEGLAVHEEGAKNPEWADPLTPEVVMAIKDKKLLPVKDMDHGFLFPDYPEQVIVSYWQAGTMCGYISEHWGDDALLGMVHSFGELKTTPETIQTNLHVSPEEFDKGYAAWLDKRVGATVAGFDQWREKLKTLAGMSKDDDAVIAMAPDVIKLYPEYVGDANAYEFLANAELTKSGDKANKQAAMDALIAYEKMGGESPGALKKLASLEEELGRPKDAAATLDRLNFIYPEDEGLHRHLGELWLAQGNNPGAVREFTAVLALKPLDMASAEFDVAEAYYAEGEEAEAEDGVLASLEAAPGYKPAQQLLLEIEAGKSSNPVTNQTNPPKHDLERTASMSMTAGLDQDAAELQQRIERFQAVRDGILAQVRQVIVGQDEVLDQILIALFVGGHCLITGMPGTAKTLMVRTIAQTLGLTFKRIQFTPDLMPSDITGTDIIEEDITTGHRKWTFVQGPIFGNVVLADEINRTPPKTQAAMLEAMQERSCTVRGHIYTLPAPFFVLATQNPIELEGTYPLPEAQLDRFLFNSLLDYLSAADEVKVVHLTTATKNPQIKAVTSAEEILDFQHLVRMVPIGESLAKYVVNLVRATRHKSDNAPDFVKKYVNYGGSIRAAQFIVLAAKARALTRRRYHVTYDDITALAVPVLRHRILLNFHAESERIDADEILTRLIAHLPQPKE